LGIGDWGLGIGDWAQSPIPNPQSPIPNPQSPFKSINYVKYINTTYNITLYFILLIYINKNNFNGLFIFHHKDSLE